MFADDLQASVGSRYDQLTARDTREGGLISRMAGWLRTAQIFTATREVVNSAYAVLERPIAEQLRALAICRAPFQRTWIEWREGDAPNQQYGILLTFDGADTRCGRCVTASRMATTKEVIVYPIVGMFDWRELPGHVPDRSGMQLRDEAQWRQACEQDSRWRGKFADAYEFTARHGFARLTDVPLLDEFSRQVQGDVVQGVSDNLHLARAFLLLLNSRNLTRVEPQVISEKLQRARAKSGKQPLLDHARITIHLSRALAARAGAATDPRNPMRLHVVRGHFKIRKSGVFWWSPHSRGSLEAGEVKRQIRKLAA
jgi:hypothetical protein